MDLKSNPLTDSPAGIAMTRAQLAGVLLTETSGVLIACVMMPRALEQNRAQIERARDAASEAAAALSELLDTMDAG